MSHGIAERDCMQQSKEGQERAKPLILLVPGERFELPDQRFTKLHADIDLVHENVSVSYMCRSQVK